MTPSLWKKVKRNKRASWWKWKRRVKKLAWNSTFRKQRSWHRVPITSWQIEGEEVKVVTDFNFLGSKITADGDCSDEIKRKEGKLWQSRQHIKKQRHHFANEDLYSQSYSFSTSHFQMWELDHKEAWAPKNRCFQIVVLKKTLESPLDSKVIKPVHPKGNQSWIFIGRTDAEAEAQWTWIWTNAMR